MLAGALAGLALARPGRAEEAVDRLVAQANALGARLLAARNLSEDAVAVSPLSLLDATALLIPGARGRTQADVANLLGPDAVAAHAALDRRLGRSAPLRRAVAAWLPLGEPPLPAYRAAVTALGAQVEAVDFADPGTLGRINGWVAERTENLIPTLIDRLSPNATLVLTAALHFAAAWDRPFDPRLTRPRRFRRVAGGTVELPFLHADRNAGFAQDTELHALRLGYATPDFELILLAPRPERPVGAVRALVAQGRVQQRLAALRFVEGPVNMAFPRFGLSDGASLLPDLRRITPVFSEGADYGGITGHRLVVSQVQQKIVLKLDEQGTEAAAATAITGTRGFALERGRFLAEAPFWAALIHRPTGMQIVSALINLPRQG